MANIFAWLKNLPRAVKLVVSVMPFIETLVKTAETPGLGPEKRETVLKGLKKFFVEQNVPKAIAGLALSCAGIVIDVYVFVQHARKVFSHEGDEEDEEE